MSSEPPGWHGKLPSLGDFASRRLPPDVLETWDNWLAAGLAGLKSTSPQTWLDDYLASPSWRFLLMPGALKAAGGDSAWAGVLMPSVDRAGRYFPFTVIAQLQQPPGGGDHFGQLQRWLHQIDDLAADALQDDWTISQLEAELARLPRPPAAGPASQRSGGTILPAGESLASVSLASAADVTAMRADDALTIWQTAVSGQAFWWCEPDADPGRLVVTRGLPGGPGFAALLGSAAHPTAPTQEPLSGSVSRSG